MSVLAHTSDFADRRALRATPARSAPPVARRFCNGDSARRSKTSPFISASPADASPTKSSAG